MDGSAKLLCRLACEYGFFANGLGIVLYLLASVQWMDGYGYGAFVA